MEKKSIDSSQSLQGRLLQASPSPSEEISGWSMYIADFIVATQAREKEEEEEQGAGFHGPSGTAGSAFTASDAASGTPWNSRGFKKLRFGRRKPRDHVAELDDDDLEDTASSPVNSPMVGDLHSSDIDAKMKADGKQIYKEGDHEYLNSRELKMKSSEDAEMIRGLCLVPTNLHIDRLSFQVILP